MTITYTAKGDVYNEARAVSLYAEFEAINMAIAAETQPKVVSILRAVRRKAWEAFVSATPFLTVVDGVPVIPTIPEPEPEV